MKKGLEHCETIRVSDVSPDRLTGALRCLNLGRVTVCTMVTRTDAAQRNTSACVPARATVMENIVVMDRQAWTTLFHRLLFTSAVWIVLSGTDAKALAVGAFAVPAATWLSLRLLPGRDRLVLWRFLRHFPSFVGGSLQGGVDVARRAISPGMPLLPGWVEVPVRLPDGGRVALGAELSLMPGTLAAGVRGDRLLVHLLDTDAGFENAIPREEAAIAAMILGTGKEVGP